jgi:hypothetical protein
MGRTDRRGVCVCQMWVHPTAQHDGHPRIQPIVSIHTHPLRQHRQYGTSPTNRIHTHTAAAQAAQATQTNGPVEVGAGDGAARLLHRVDGGGGGPRDLQVERRVHVLAPLCVCVCFFLGGFMGFMLVWLCG